MSQYSHFFFKTENKLSAAYACGIFLLFWEVSLALKKGRHMISAIHGDPISLQTLTECPLPNPHIYSTIVTVTSETNTNKTKQFTKQSNVYTTSTCSVCIGLCNYIAMCNIYSYVHILHMGGGNHPAQAK